MSEQPLRVEARFKNARLYNAIQAELPGTPGPPVNGCSQGRIGQFCRFHQVPLGLVSSLLCLRVSPWLQNGRFRPVCYALAERLNCDPAWLFPRELYEALLPRLLTRDVEVGAFLPLQAAAPRLALPPSQDEDVFTGETKQAVRELLAELQPREAQVLSWLFGLDGEELTEAEIATRLKLSRSRIHQIEHKALRKLRHPSRSRQVRPFMEGIIVGQ